MNLDCNYNFPIDLAPNRISSDAKLIGKMLLKSKIGLIKYNSDKNFSMRKKLS